MLLDETRNSNSGDTDVRRAQSYSHQDPSAGSPAKGLEGGSSSSGCLDDSVDRDQGPAPPGPGQGCCKTWLEIQREECFLRPALAHRAGQKDPPSLSIKSLYARNKKPSYSHAGYSVDTFVPLQPRKQPFSFSKLGGSSLSANPHPLWFSGALFGCLWIVVNGDGITEDQNQAYWITQPAFGCFLHYKASTWEQFLENEYTLMFRPDGLIAQRLLAVTSPPSAKLTL